MWTNDMQLAKAKFVKVRSSSTYTSFGSKFDLVVCGVFEKIRTAITTLVELGKLF